MGPVGSQEDTSGSRMVPSGSVYQSYTDTGQSSDPSGLVGSRRAISGSDGFPAEPCFGTTRPDGARRIARLVRIGAQLMFGPPGHATASPRALRVPVGPRRPPAGPRGGLRGTLGELLVGAHCQTWTILDLGQSPTMSQHAGFWQPYSNFSNRPYPLAQNRSTI